MENTIERLSYMASGLKLCDPRLRDLGYRTIHFKRHNYFMLYRIQDDMVYVDAIYHNLQNYENISSSPLPQKFLVVKKIYIQVYRIKYDLYNWK